MMCIASPARPTGDADQVIFAVQPRAHNTHEPRSPVPAPDRYQWFRFASALLELHRPLP